VKIDSEEYGVATEIPLRWTGTYRMPCLRGWAETKLLRLLLFFALLVW
jgi:hypothetical protein